MPRSKKQPPAAKPKARWPRFLIWVALLALIASAWNVGGKHWHFPWSPPGVRTVDELLAQDKYHGFELLQEPDRPGPYREMNATSTGSGQGAVGSFWANGKTCHYNVAGAPGRELRIVGLVPVDGGAPTYMVLQSSTTKAPI